MGTRSRCISVGAVAIAVVLAVGLAPAHAQNKCLAGKTKCVNKKVAGLLKCNEKCQKDPAKCGGAQTACEDKVTAKFEGDGIDPATSCFGKLEAKNDGPCVTTGDRAAMETTADNFVAGVVSALAAGRFVDNGDGTVTDNLTGLQWEKKTGSVASPVVCQACPATHTWTGPFNVTYPISALYTITITVDSTGTAWTGTVTVPPPDPPTPCSGTISGSAITGVCGPASLTGTLNCAGETASGTWAQVSPLGIGAWWLTTAVSDACTDPRNVNNRYAWSANTAPNGTVFSEFLDKMNGGHGAACLGGRCDWRLPTVEELQTILLAPCPGGTNPCIDTTAFGTTAQNWYWSSTTDVAGPFAAWDVHFFDGAVSDGSGKGNNEAVRAVRGGQ